MKKTAFINLSGMAFRIEEDACERLDTYLNEIKTRLGKNGDATETVADIESRMAELFSAVAPTSERSITIDDVEEVIQTLGDPSEFGAGTGSDTTAAAQPAWKARRLYRDPQSRIVAGVCGGLGAFFGIDPIIFRLLFVIGLFNAISVLPYLILWIVMPKAITIEQRARMTAGSTPSQSRQRASAHVSPAGSQSGATTVKALKTALGVIILICNFFFLLALTVSIFAASFSIGAHTGIAWLRELTGLFLAPSTIITALVGTALVAGIPAIMIFYLALHLIFSFKRGGRLIGIIALLLWLGGIGITICAAITVAGQFREHTVITYSNELQPVASDTIYIKASPNTPEGNRLFSINNMRAVVYSQTTRQGNRTTVHTNGRIAAEGKPVISIVRNAGRFAITDERQSRGATTFNAEANTAAIEYEWIQNQNTLLLNKTFALKKGTPLRGQRIALKIEIPAGKHLEIDPEIAALVHLQQ